MTFFLKIKIRNSFQLFFGLLEFISLVLFQLSVGDVLFLLAALGFYLFLKCDAPRYVSLCLEAFSFIEVG